MTSSNKVIFEDLLKTVFQSEIAEMIESVSLSQTVTINKYLTIGEVSALTGIGSYTLRQLTFSRAMPHRKIRSRIIFEQSEIIESISNYKKMGWTDPDNSWDVKTVQSQIANFYIEKEKPLMIEEIFRKLVKEELENFSKEFLNIAKKRKTKLLWQNCFDHKRSSRTF